MNENIPYEKPAIISTTNLEAKALTCINSDTVQCGSGPISTRE